MIVLVDYASPSVFESTRDQASLAVATNVRRPVRFSGIVRRHGFNLRIALRALGEAIWSNDTWVPGLELLDPIITVHPDRIFFEAFSQDQSVYAALIVDPAVFETEGEVVTGTTNVDFSAWLGGALGEMRTGRPTRFRIGPEGFEVRTTAAGGRFERKVDVPETWVRGFLQLQAAMGLPGTRIDVQPIDLLAALRFLRYTKAKISPRALRYEFEPGQDARLVLEPWEQVVPLAGATHNYTERKVTRVWGRRRLKLIEGLLPFAEAVQVYLKGRALPSFYAVKLAGMTFVLGLSGFSEASFTGTGGFDLLQDTAAADDVLLGPALDLLKREVHRSGAEVAAVLGIDQARATRLLVRLCRQGRCIFDVETRRYRHRELFETPADEARYFPPDLRRELAAHLSAEGRVRIASCATQETTKTRRLKSPVDGTPLFREVIHRDWHISGSVGDIPEVQVVVGDSGSIIFGRCACPFFDANLMNQGPCEHILALFQESAERCVDRPTSVETQAPGSDTQNPGDVDEDV
jgi:predicted ArsR family transcriptional regulator